MDAAAKFPSSSLTGSFGLLSSQYEPYVLPASRACSYHRSPVHVCVQSNYAVQLTVPR